jgi:AcrR family transcriptional regulator
MSRGEHLLDALVKVVSAGGMAAVSVRAVAAAAGVSTAQVQYYFRTKDELIAAAYHHVAEQMKRRVRALDRSGTPRDAVRRALHVWLPLDETRARNARVWLTFAAAASVSEALRPLSAEWDGELKRWVAGFLLAAQRGGDLADDLDPDLEAAVLLAVLDGLVVQALVLSEDTRAGLVVAGIDSYLDRLFTKANGTTR